MSTFLQSLYNKARIEVRDERGGTTSSLYYETKIKLINFEYGEPLKE